MYNHRTYGKHKNPQTEYDIGQFTNAKNNFSKELLINDGISVFDMIPKNQTFGLKKGGKNKDSPKNQE